MLHKLFGSKTRVQVLSVFLANPDKKFYAQQVIKLAKVEPANAFRELRGLEDMGLLDITNEGGRSYYRLNQDSVLTPGLSSIFSSSRHGHLPVFAYPPRDSEEVLQNKKWYHQSFDGVPIFILVIAEAELRREKRKPVGTEADVRVCFFGNKVGDWYLDMADIERGADVIARLSLKDDSLSEKIMASWKEDEKRFEDLFWKEFPNLDVRNISNSELIAFWERYYEIAVSRFTSSAIIDHFALGMDERIQSMLRKEIYGQPAGKSLGSAEFGQIFADLTAPTRQSFVTQAQIDLLKIGTGQSKEKLSDYQKRYFWLANNYADAYILSSKYFEKELKTWAKKENLAKELARLKNFLPRNIRTKKSLIRKYKISEKLQNLLRISEDFGWWQDERKRATFMDTHVRTEILKAVAARTNYDLDELKYCTPPEIKTVILHGHPSRAELTARSKGCVVVATREGFHVLTDKEMEVIRSAMFPSESFDEVEEVRGLPACLGRAVGTVKIVQSAREIDKVKKGDILVAVMTRPDYVPAMRRAAAIVTNEGGITSHAAIVSRELGVPCIIGTKIATKVFHDGDKVEVNANHGLVRRIQ